MIDAKMKEMEMARILKVWIVHSILRHIMIRTYEIFDHERFMKEHRVKMLPIFIRIKSRFRKRVFGYGKPYEVRIRKQVRDVQSIMFGTCLRLTLRERAKKTIKDYCQSTYDKTVLLAKFQQYIEKVSLI